MVLARTLDEGEAAHVVRDLAQLLRHALGVGHGLVEDAVSAAEHKGVRVRPPDRRARRDVCGASGGGDRVVYIVHGLEDVESRMLLECGDLGAGTHGLPFPANITGRGAPNKRVTEAVVIYRYGRSARQRRRAKE